MTQDLCRAEFENVIPVPESHLTRDEIGMYVNREVRDNWIMFRCGWQACYERFAKPATEHNPADTSQNVEWVL